MIDSRLVEELSVRRKPMNLDPLVAKTFLQMAPILHAYLNLFLTAAAISCFCHVMMVLAVKNEV